MRDHRKLKQNVQRFNEDIEADGTYKYTADTFSGRYSNDKITQVVRELYNFCGKHILDVGCGDGKYTIEFLDAGVDSIVGVDPAENAIEIARSKVGNLDASKQSISFQVGDIYNLSFEKSFDCVVLRGVLHHVSDAKAAIACVGNISNTLVIAEPNGANLGLKILEKCSSYHVQHEERSYLARTYLKWCREAGFKTFKIKYTNLVPMMCPDALAKVLGFLTPVVERIPLINLMCCGQFVIVATK